MTFQLDVKVDVRQVERMLTSMERTVIPKAAARALNRTRDQVATVARREIAKDMGIPQKRVTAGMFKLKATVRKLVAAIDFKGRPINLIRFKAKQTKKGVTATAWGKRWLYKSTFIGNKGRTVFVRKGKKRLPIRAVWGPAIPKTMLQEKITSAMQKVASDRWQINFTQDLKFFLSKMRL